MFIFCVRNISSINKLLSGISFPVCSKFASAVNIYVLKNSKRNPLSND